MKIMLNWDKNVVGGRSETVTTQKLEEDIFGAIEDDNSNSSRKHFRGYRVTFKLNTI